MDMTMRVDRSSKTLRERTLDKLREAIVSQHFRPGDRLVERELCDQLGVSRTLVREALRYLEAEGLVETLGHRGPVVAKLTIEETRQIYEIRIALESLAARACARKGSPETVARLEQALANMKNAYKKNQPSAVLAEATTFYATLFEEADKAIAWNIISSLHSRINHLRALTITTPGRSEEGPAQMQKIIDAIRIGDEDAAARACFDHVNRAAMLADQIIRGWENAE